VPLLNRCRILLIEDDPDIQLVLKMKLIQTGHEVLCCDGINEGWHQFEADDWDLVLLDHELPDGKGLTLLEKVKKKEPDMPVIYLTAHNSTTLAVKATKMGAHDYITKPFDLDDVDLVVNNTLEMTRLRRELRLIRQRNADDYGLDKIVGNSPAINAIKEICRTVAQSQASSVLLTGESGVGKNLIAQAIHYNSDRTNHPFLTITVTALPEQLLESELFGHERGAFTDARERKLGLFEMGNKGTIFLDEIGDLPLPLQAKLLGVLESRKIRRVGGTVDIPIDARIIAATNQDLRQAVAEKRFRSDLFYRINVIQVEIPSLRERKEDLSTLCHFFIDYFNRSFKKQIQGVNEAVMQAMQNYDWPGNVREFRNLIERAMILGRGPLLTLKDFPVELRDQAPMIQEPGRFTLPEEGLDLAELEKDLLCQALQRTGGNRTKAAKLLNLSRDQMRYRIKANQLEDVR
jgi:DNA-binding NtrC family response regulator